MELNITIKGLDGDGKSDAIKNYITEESAKIKNFIACENWSPVVMDAVVSVSALHANHEFEVHIRVPHFKVIVKKHGDDVYKLIKRVMDVTLEDLHGHKRKMLDKRKDGNGFHRP